MNVNGSITPVDFEFEATGDGQIILGLSWYISDANIRIADRFGGQMPLTNGCDLIITDPDDNVVFDMFNGEGWKINADAVVLSPNLVDVQDAGTDTLTGRMEFDIFTAQILPEGFTIILRINDDLTGLAMFNMYISGRNN